MGAPPSQPVLFKVAPWASLMGVVDWQLETTPNKGRAGADFDILLFIVKVRRRFWKETSRLARKAPVGGGPVRLPQP